MRPINCLVVVMTFISWLLATKYTAYQLQSKLWGLEQLPLYAPTTLIIWMFKYYATYPVIFNQALYILMLGIGSGVIVVYMFKRPKAMTYGTASWATAKAVRQMNITAPTGVILGKFPGVGMLVNNGPEHVLLVAPTRSGKGVGFIIPTLLAWEGSVVVLDLKKENFAATSTWRANMSRVVCFDPTSNDGACWNPLLEVRKGVHEVQDVQHIADILIDPNGQHKVRNHWMQTGHSLLVAVILHVLYSEQEKTLAGVTNFLTNPERDLMTTLNYMQYTCHAANKPHPVISSLVQEMLNKAPEELSGVVSTATSALALYRDPLVARSTSKSDFMISDLVSDKALSLYLAIPAGDLDRLTSLNRLIINLLCRRLTGTMVTPQQALPAKLLLLLDEFPSLGCMEFFRQALGFMAGYNIKCFLVCQSYNNIYEHYGAKNSIIDNCQIRAVMAPNDYDTAQIIANSLGQTTVTAQQVNFAGQRLAAFLPQVAVNNLEIKRNLLNPDEVQRLPKDQVIIMVGNFPPVMAKKIIYYEDEPFKSRALITNSRAAENNSKSEEPSVVVAKSEAGDQQQTKVPVVATDRPDYPTSQHNHQILGIIHDN